MLKRLLFGGSTNSRSVDFGMLILRVFIGSFLALAHGMSKLPPDGIKKMTGFLESMNVPAPGAAAWAAMLAEFVGGGLLALGLCTRPVAAIITFNMTVAILTAHRHGPLSAAEPALLYLVPALFFVFAGSGRYGVDALIRGNSKAG